MAIQNKIYAADGNAFAGGNVLVLPDDACKGELDLIDTPGNTFELLYLFDREKSFADDE